MPTPEPLNLLQSLVDAFERLERHHGDPNTVQLGYRVLRIISDVDGDLSQPVEHAHLLPEGGTLEDLVVECLAKIEDALEEINPEATPDVDVSDKQFVDAE